MHLLKHQKKNLLLMQKFVMNQQNLLLIQQNLLLKQHILIFMMKKLLLKNLFTQKFSIHSVIIHIHL